VVSSLVDYEFQFDQTVFNSSRAAGSYSFKVLKKSNSPTVELAPNNSDELEVYLNDSSTPLDSWSNIPYEIDETEKRVYVLKNKEGFVWDREVVEFLSDGEVIQIRTNVSQVVGTYNENGLLSYTPNQIIATVHRIIGKRDEPITDSCRLTMEIDYAEDSSGVGSVEGSSATLTGDVDSIVITAYDKKTGTFLDSKTIEVTGKTNSIVADEHRYQLSKSREGVEFKEEELKNWVTSRPQVTPDKPFLWAIDRFKYSNGVWITNAPYLEEYGPEYSLSLDNYADLVSRLSTGKYLVDSNNPIVVNVTRRVGGQNGSTEG
jgi:hypothetical protein